MNRQLDFKLTVAIPTYNRLSQLKLSLLSVLEQRRRIQQETTVEVLVVDNCSDLYDIFEVLTEIQERYAFRILKNRANLGIDGNVNRCLCEARGHFIWFVSDDDIIEGDAIDTILQFAESNSTTGLLLANFRVFDETVDKCLSRPMIRVDQQCPEGVLAYLTYLPSVIVNKDILCKTTSMSQFDKYLGSLYYHMAIAIWLAHQSGFKLVEGTHIRFRSGCSELGGTTNVALDPYRIFKCLYNNIPYSQTLASDHFFFANVWPLIKHRKRRGDLKISDLKLIIEEYKSIKHIIIMLSTYITPKLILISMAKFRKKWLL